MTTFSQAMPDTRAAPRKVVLPPAAFADTWSMKLPDDVCVGLRLISVQEVETARGLAAEQVGQWHTNHATGRLHDYDCAEDAHNEAWMRHCVARATCDVNDVSKPYFEFAENTIREAMTVEGIRRLWDELLILHASCGSLALLAADDEDLVRLAGILTRRKAMGALDATSQTEARKLLGHVLCMLIGTGEADAHGGPEFVDHDPTPLDEEQSFHPEG